MYPKTYIKSLLIAVLSLAAAGAAFGQTAPVSGKVQLQKADGTVEPINGALVEVFRTDIKASFPSDKTNKRGEFSFAGLPLGATFVLSASAPGAKASILPNIKAGQDKLVITLTEGDGKRWTEEEVRQALASAAASSGGTAARELTAEEKKAQEEFLKQKAAVEAKNKEIENKNAIIQKALQEGNSAYEAKNFDLAVAKYTEGIDADPEFAGSAPILLNNRGIALRSRGSNVYNQAVKSTEASAKADGILKAKKDFADSVESYVRSLTVLKNAPAGEIDPKTAEAAKAAALRGIKDSLSLMVQTRQVDEAILPKAAEFIPQYIAVEADAAKKAEAQLLLADLYRVAGDSDKAIVEYKKVLESSPDNVEALAGLGFSLVNSGYIDNDKAKLQEGANILQKFASIAPDSHRFKDDAVQLIQTLKAEQNVTPQKVTPTKKKN